MKECSVDGCTNNTWATGERLKRVTNKNALNFCRKHCQWFDKYGCIEPGKYAQGSLDFRFWKHVNKLGPDDCWEWTAYKNKNGYGRLWDLATKKNKLAHRVSYELNVGKLHKYLHVMHTCDNPSCVNPNHLSLGTPKENTQDMIKKGRNKPYAAFGEDNARSKLTLEQVKYIKAHPEMKHTELAKMFDLSPNGIRSVRIGRTWRDA